MPAESTADPAISTIAWLLGGVPARGDAAVDRFFERDFQRVDAGVADVAANWLLAVRSRPSDHDVRLLCSSLLELPVDKAVETRCKNLMGIEEEAPEGRAYAAKI